MKYEERELDAAQLLATLPHPHRSEGLHVSRIYGDIMVTLGHFSSERELPWVKITTGTLFERAFETALAGAIVGNDPRFIRPGEFIKDGIICTPDALDKDEWVLHEYKCTWMSCRHDLTAPRFMHWEMQVKAYCYVLNTERAVITALFINGRYDGEGPKLMQYEIAYQPHELEENWSMLVNHAKRRGWL